MIIWDEYKHGVDVYKASSTKTKKWQTNELRSLIKYLLSENSKIPMIDIRNEIEKCCSNEIKYLTKKQKTNIFNKLISQCLDQDKKVKIIKDKPVTIYVSEIEKIKTIRNKYIEQLVFVMIVYSKWLGLEWFSISKSDLKKEAKLNNLNNDSFQELLSSLFQEHLVDSDVKKLDRFESRKEKIKKKQMWKVNFLENDGEIAFEFNNYINFVYRYLNYVYGGYFECSECGGMFEQSLKNNKTRCDKCNKYNPIPPKTIKCKDCGKEIVIDACDMKTKRCKECQKIYRNNYQKELMRKKRSKC